MRKPFHKLFLFVSCFVLAACSTSTAHLNLTATKHLNQDTANHSLPVVVRVYVLTNDEEFIDASFRELWRNDKAILGSTMLDREEYTLDPGGRLTIKVPYTVQAKYIAVVALFRHPHGSDWRVIHTMPGRLDASFTRLTITLNGSTLKLDR
jgi:type VI secretion system VasD/TssJ family lipoprotein